MKIETELESGCLIFSSNTGFLFLNRLKKPEN